MTPGSNLLPSGLLDRLVSFVASVGDAIRRVRYRCAELRRIGAVEMVSDRGFHDEGIRWVPAVRVRGRSHVTLVCTPNSRVTYDVTLTPNASVRSWCALAPEATGPNVQSVEFEIHVRTQSLESSSRRLISPRSSWVGRHWHALSVHTGESGPARIVLTTRCPDGTRTDTVGALWGNPRIEARRSMTDLLSALRSAMAGRNMRGLWHSALPAGPARLYDLWVRENEPSRGALDAQRQWSLGRARSFSLITFVTEPASSRTADSVRRQSYPLWEWIFVATEDSVQDVRHAVARIVRDERVRVLSVPSGSTRAEAWNCALHGARGEFAALLGQDDVLAPSALYEMAVAIEGTPDGDLFYSDEDRVSHRALQRGEPHFKPDWSPELLLALNYIGRLAMFRVGTAVGVGGFRDGCGAAEEWDFLLRLSRYTSRIRRVPRCLYHRGETASRDAEDGAEAVLQDHCRHLGLQVSVTRTRSGSRVAWDVQEQPTVSIVIPNRNAAAVLEQCLRGLRLGTTYQRRELIIVDNGSTERKVLDLYRSLERDGFGRIVPFDRPFNFSAACNAGAAAAHGDLLLFLNNDIEVIQPDWLEELIRWAQRPEVGIVGAKLLYPDRTIQHAGVVFGLGLVGHIFGRAAEGESGLFGSSESYRNYLAVTGACQMMRKDVFWRLGGYDERFRLSFSDVILCMEAWKAGLRVVYTPHARLVHHESYTRKREDSAEDMELLARYLQANRFVQDPYFHPELNPKSSLPAVRPPFDPTPQQVIREYVERVLAAAALS